MTYWIGSETRDIKTADGHTIKNVEVPVYRTLDGKTFLNEAEAKARAAEINAHPDARFRAAVGFYNDKFDPDTLLETGFWEIIGQEGHNLGVFQGTLEEAYRFAIELPMFYYWTDHTSGLGGRVERKQIFTKVDLVNIQNGEFVGAPSQRWTKRNRA